MSEHSKRVGVLGSRDFGVIDKHSPNYLDLDSQMGESVLHCLITNLGVSDSGAHPQIRWAFWGEAN